MHPNESFANFATEPIKAEFWHRPVGPEGERIKFWIGWLRSGNEVPPLLIAHHEGDEKYWRTGGLNWYVHDGTHRLSAMRMIWATSGYQHHCWAEILSQPPVCWDDMREWKRTGKYLRVW